MVNSRYRETKYECGPCESSQTAAVGSTAIAVANAAGRQADQASTPRTITTAAIDVEKNRFRVKAPKVYASRPGRLSQKSCVPALVKLRTTSGTQAASPAAAAAANPSKRTSRSCHQRSAAPAA